MLAVVFVACSNPESRDAGRPSNPDAGGGPPLALRLEAIIRAEDARNIQQLNSMVESRSAPERARVALALGRCQAPEGAAALRKLLLDEAPAVRDAAAFGMGLLGEAATPDDERALLGRLAAEGQVDSRVALADALGRVGGEPALPALAALLQDPEERVRVQAAIALASFGLRSKPIGSERVTALMDQLAPGERESVRAAAAYALARAAGKLEGDAATAAAAALGAALADAAPDVRMFAARAFSALPPGPVDALVARQDDPDWRVRVNVVRALAKRGGAAGAAPAVRAALALAFSRAQREGVGGPAVHPLAAGLEVAADLVDNPGLRAVVQQIHAGALALDGPATARDLVHCQAAFALDRAGNWPRFVTTCGTPTASPAQRLALEARLLGTAHGDDAARAGRLVRLFGSEHALVRAAAVEAAAGIAAAPARALVRRGLVDADPAVVAAAAEGVAAHPARFSRAAAPPLPASETDGGAVVEHDAGPPPTPVPDAAVVEQLEALVDRLRDGEEAETLLSVIGALGALKAGASSRLVPLLRHPVLAVRRKAEEAHRAITGEPAPRPGPPLPPRRPADAAAVARLAAGPALHAVLHTTRGDVRIRLLVAEAPGTVLNFVTLARQGFYATRTLHRVVPNFVIQGGDPRGDGYGGPGYSIRCELGPTPYRRGSVGMALAGPDTGGSQFFLMHSRHPHLDARYTLFAEVVSGQEVVDAIVPGDAVTSVAIE
jgi:cyclophilin family peptidyl-prolyl cis-trans isomerase/HEAT repeat protein